MKVSIITVSYNSSSTIADTIASVVGQTYSSIEYLVVDGASNDGTLNIVKSYEAGVSRLISESDKGIYDAMNKGVAHATGDIVGILNSDDFYTDSEVIADVVRTFEESGCDALYADLDYVDQLDTSHVVRRWKAGQFKKGIFLSGWMPPHPTFFVRREVYQKYGTYNLTFRSAADYELMLRMMHKYEVRVAYLPRTIIHMRTGGQSNVSLKNRIKANMEDREAWRVNGLKPKWYTLTWKPLRKLGQFFR